MASVEFRKVSKRFGGVTAVRDVGFEIGDGEFVCLLGPSGCGKTTSLRMIAGLEIPTSGKVLIGGEDVTDLHPRDRQVSMVFQDYALYPHMTLADNIAYPLKVRGEAEAKRHARAREVAEVLRIGDLLGRLPSQISGGQQQRTALARALVYPSRVYLFDEPLSNLDAKLRHEARGFLNHLQRDLGMTAVYVTHDQAEAMALATRIAVMDKGRIVQFAPPI
jgi:multiple sugar transport system ATP-binding protein